MSKFFAISDLRFRPGLIPIWGSPTSSRPHNGSCIIEIILVWCSDSARISTRSSSMSTKNLNEKRYNLSLKSTSKSDLEISPYFHCLPDWSGPAIGSDLDILYHPPSAEQEKYDDSPKIFSGSSILIFSKGYRAASPPLNVNSRVLRKGWK